MSCSDLFEKEETLLATHTRANGEKVSVYQVSLGATTEDVIQVRNGKKNVQVLRAYNCFINSSLIGDTVLKLVLTDTGYHSHNSIDTINVNLR